MFWVLLAEKTNEHEQDPRVFTYNPSTLKTKLGCQEFETNLGYIQSSRLTWVTQ